MAALTQSAIDAVLGALATAIQDEARLIGGVHSDMKFIKDEMDSMNGFLMHLNKMEGDQHDDQVRAWMKQVREVSYVAEDCVDRYMRVVTHYGGGWGEGGCTGSLTLAFFILAHPKAYCELSKLGKQIAELKARVRDVGERRERYGVSVPTGIDLKKTVQSKLPDQVEEKRESFVHALEKDVVGTPSWFRSEAYQSARAQDSAAATKKKDSTSTPESAGKDSAAAAKDSTSAPADSASKNSAAATKDSTSTPADSAAATKDSTSTPEPAGKDSAAAAKDPTSAPADSAAATKDSTSAAALESASKDSAPTLDPLGALLLEDTLVSELPASPIAPSEAGTMRAILKKCCPPHHPGGAGDQLAVEDDESKAKAADEEAEFRCTRKMFLCAMYVYPYPTRQELEKLKNKVVGVTNQEARNQVMIFCYSILTTQQKSCLQYVTAFLHESEISRTSMVRRWVAEGLVGKEPEEGRSGTTPEESGERCFRELLLRGFVRAARRSDAGTVKSCVMDDPVSRFITRITKSENFVAELPAHLDRQLKIRSIVQRRASMPPPPPMLVRRCNLRCCGGGCTWLLDDHRASEDATAKDPMDELVDFIRALPELYRLNVLDLGGCTGLKSRHLKSFAEVECLKYLSLRSTDVSRLHASYINKFTLLETLDIRGTNIPPRDTMGIYLPKLKHLLAGHQLIKTATAPSLVTVHMPDRIGSMREMETLSHVQVSMDGAELQGVARLHQLRKLGVVVHANTSTAALLGRVLYMLAANLRSLSVWVAIAVRHHTTTQQSGGSGILDISSMYEMASSLVLENLDIKGKMSLPSWIGRASKLVNVTLRDTEMDGGDALRRLATVQSLRCLKLSRKAFTEQVLRFKDVQFQALKLLVVEGDAVTRIAFLADDAAPKLEKIVWIIGGGSKIAQMYSENLITGINNLHKSLTEIEFRASFNLANLLEWTKKPPQTTTSPASSLGVEEPNQTKRKVDKKVPRYHIRYISSSAGNQLITEVLKTDDNLTLPAGVIN